MLKEVTKEEAINQAMKGQEIIMIDKRKNDDDLEYYCTLSLTKMVSTIFEDAENPRFLVDVPEDQPEAKKKGGRPRVDQGKIQALHDAGWNNQDIADEMKISITTVNSYVKKLEEEEG